jgi:hypothetical protein
MEPKDRLTIKACIIVDQWKEQIPFLWLSYFNKTKI